MAGERNDIMSILFERVGFVAILTLHRPEVYNAMNRELLLSLREHLLRIRDDKDIRVVIVTGSGEKAFSSGADLKERRQMTELEVQQYIINIRDTFTLLERIPQPVIAAINGVALGGGTELALACDLRLIADTGSMGLTETTLGIIPGAGGTQRLPRIVGTGWAKELIFSGKKISAMDAKSIGLVNRVCSVATLYEEALQLANQIADNAPLAISQAKKVINEGVEVHLHTGLEMESLAYQALIQTRDRQEGLLAFAEKRKPNYVGE